MSRIPIFIPFVNRPDLLDKAVASVRTFPSAYPLIINNSGEPLGILADKYNPPVPLTASQSLNLMQYLASGAGVPFYFFLHNDAEAGAGTVEALYTLAREKTERGDKWGVIFTNYDALAAYNTAAFADPAVGPWDQNLPQYYTDNCMYRRLRLAGYEMVSSELPVHHVGSRTLHSDPIRERVNRITFPIYGQYYAQKWGGPPGSETFDKPWGGQ